MFYFHLYVINFPESFPDNWIYWSQTLGWPAPYTQSFPGIRTGRMRVLTGVKLLLFAGLSLGLRVDDWQGDDIYNYQDEQAPSPQLRPRQDTQDGSLNNLLVPAFITTFTASSIANLLFPSAPLFPTIPGEKQEISQIFYSRYKY